MDGTRQRIHQATTAALSWQPVDADGEPADPGTVTVGVVRSNGVEILPAGTATAGSGDAARTVALTVAQTALLDIITATWTVDSTIVAVTTHDIVGGYYCTSADLRGNEPSLSDTAKYPLATLIAARAEIETLIESVCAMAFVPRFNVVRTSSNGNQIVLPHAYLRRVRWLRHWTSPTSVTTLSDDECAAILGNDAGVAQLDLWYDDCPFSVEVGYEHGTDAPPYDLRRAVLTAARAQANVSRSGIPDRATLLQLADGGTVSLATPGLGPWHTGIPAVDEVLARYQIKTPSTA